MDGGGDKRVDGIKIVNTCCCIIVAICFVVIAYSQYQSQKAQWALAEAQKMSAAADLMKDGYLSQIMRSTFLRRVNEGWEPKDALLYAFDNEDVTRPLPKARLEAEFRDAEEWYQKVLKSTGERKN